ncbi:MAG: heparan-alpha-glucosaminide N-acetyltransferase [Candidatus Diapherotrites archaeon]|nr:heparan-alpha-glucosaminide N-acetyltransferase [Candidatus Diapherotrites archaeon]
MKERFLEIDAFRGIAVCLMVLFHFLFDLNYFRGLSFDLSFGLWLFVGRSSALIFLLLVGISLTLSNANALQDGLGGKERRWKFLKRGFGVFCLGLLVTAVTFLLFPQETIWFGVLHLIGVSIIIAFPFLKFKRLNIALGILAIIAGLLLWNLSFGFAWLLPFGFQPYGFVSFDYFPILPSFGVVLLGIALGNWLYAGGKRNFRPLILENSDVSRLLAFLGKNSLIIYLLHQPVIIGVLLFLA